MIPEISVVMPVRNGGATLEAALESILAQRDADFEIVVVDHDSTDHTPAILDQFSRRHGKLRVETCRGTFVDAANLSWRLARAPLVARMDADDLARPGRLCAQKKFLQDHPDIVACGSLVRIRRRDGNGRLVLPEGGYQRYQEWINSVITPDQIRRQRFVDSPLPNPSAMIRRGVLAEIGGYRDPSWAEDYDLWLRILDRGWKLGKVDEVLLDWIDAPERSTRNLERYDLSEFQRAKAHYFARLPGIGAKGVAICGAGPIGKEFARLLRELSIPVHAFLEVNPRQIGMRIHAIPVLDARDVGRFAGNAYVVGASGRPGARKRIRDLATDHGLTEGESFFSIA